MKDFKSAAKVFGYYCRIALKGFARMLFGTGTTALLALAVYGFIKVASGSGWIAVCEFIGAAALMLVGLISMYVQGGSGRKNNGGNKR